MSFANNSRYLRTNVIRLRSSITGKLVKPAFVNLRDRVTDTASDDRSLLYDTVDSWGGIALRALGDAGGWWAIADLSGIVDPFEELVEGKQLRVPSVARYQLNILPSDRGDF